MQEPLDEGAMRKEIITTDLGLSFPLPMRVGGGLFLVFGALSILNIPLIGIPVALAGAMTLWTRHGVQIDVHAKHVKFYTRYLGLWTRGSWQSVEKYPFITLLRGKSGYRMTSLANAQSTVSFDSYDVVLLNSTHRKKLVIDSCENKEKALARAKELASILGLTTARYQPKASGRPRQ